MHNAIQLFRTNISRVRAIGTLYDAISQLTTSAIDLSDILRAEIVMAVSALDHYIHEITRLGMLEICCGRRPSTKAFLRFQISLETSISGIACKGTGSWLEDEIREKHGYLAFQHPDKIADAIRLISDCKLWDSIAAIIGMPAQDTKNRLCLIIERRNKIAHEADIDPSFPGTRWPIHKPDVIDTVNFIEKICESINSIVI